MLELIKRYKMLLIIIGLILSNIICFTYKEIQKESQEVTLQKVSEDEEVMADEAAEEIVPVEAKQQATQQAAFNASNVVPMTQTPQAVLTVPVHVCGAVAVPGVYYVESTAIVQEVIQLSGGLTPEADSEAINLARPIKAYEKIYIPKVGEEIDKSADSYDNKEAGMVTQEGGIPTSQTQISDNISAQSALININTASVSELTTLSGIGEVKAKAIIAYRETVGQFGSIEEIKNVSGIGEKTFEKIKACITI